VRTLPGGSSLDKRVKGDPVVDSRRPDDALAPGGGQVPHPLQSDRWEVDITAA